MFFFVFVFLQQLPHPTSRWRPRWPVASPMPLTTIQSQKASLWTWLEPSSMYVPCDQCYDLSRLESSRASLRSKTAIYDTTRTGMLLHSHQHQWTVWMLVYILYIVLILTRTYTGTHTHMRNKQPGATHPFQFQQLMTRLTLAFPCCLRAKKKKSKYPVAAHFACTWNKNTETKAAHAFISTIISLFKFTFHSQVNMMWMSRDVKDHILTSQTCNNIHHEDKMLWSGHQLHLKQIGAPRRPHLLSHYAQA